MNPTTPPSLGRRTNVRYGILGFLFLVTALNMADRQTLSMVGAVFSEKFALSDIAMGYLLSAFSWAYVAVQIPGGWLLDRLGSKRVYHWCIALWSLFTLLQGFVGVVVSGTTTTVIGGAMMAFTVLFGLRLLLGLAEAPAFPANSRIVASWFPTAERGTASAIFNAAQYGSTVLFLPVMGWITHELDWQCVFFFMGAFGLGLALIWPRLIHGPREHPRVNAAEIEHIASGGGLVDLDRPGKSGGKAIPRSVLGQLLGNRMLLGIYFGQYCINTLTVFFLTWFPIYLVKDRHMTILKVGFMATLPALCGLAGGIFGGWFSDLLLRRGCSLSFARKLPIVAGMLLAASMVGCNYLDAEWALITLMSLAYFGKGVGALGWTVIADSSPKEIVGLSGGMFNMFGGIAGITTPIAIGYIVNNTKSFDGALWFVGAHAVLAAASFLFVVGKIKRVELRPA